jgi:3-oxoacyl-[acyl-carrier protein] reductase
LADRGVKEGVRVNAINPGAIVTDRLNIRIKALSDERSIPLEDAAGLMAKELGVDRFGEPREIANAVAFLASPASGYCQGTILDIDGGQTRTL